MSTCAHCGHTRQPDETQSPLNCPACGIEYGQRVDLHAYQIDDRPKPVGIIPRQVLIGGGVLIVLCLLAFLAFTQRDRRWDETEAVKPVAAAPVAAAQPAAPAVVAPVEEPSEAEKRLAHELWLSMAFAERTGKEFQRFADSPPSQLGERSDALFALKRDWDEMILSNPCIAAAQPILSSALSQASDAVTAKRIGDPDRAAITIAATEEYARFVQAVQACKQPGAAAPATPVTTAPPATSLNPEPSTASPPPVPITEVLDAMQEDRKILSFSERWQKEMTGLMTLLASPRPSQEQIAAHAKALTILQQEWKQLELKDSCMAGIKHVYDDSITLALLAITTFLQDKPEHAGQLLRSADQMTRFLKEAKACTDAKRR